MQAGYIMMRTSSRSRPSVRRGSSTQERNTLDEAEHRFRGRQVRYVWVLTPGLLIATDSRCLALGHGAVTTMTLVNSLNYLFVLAFLYQEQQRGRGVPCALLFKVTYCMFVSSHIALRVTGGLLCRALHSVSRLR